MEGRLGEEYTTEKGGEWEGKKRNERKKERKGKPLEGGN